MNINDLTIGQARELAAMFGGAQAAPAVSTPAAVEHGLCILVADRGWVFVGRVIEHGDRFEMRDSRTVIRWGTTKGLEELAERGPLTNTNLGDTAATRMIPRESVRFVVACNANAWRA